MRVVCTSGRVLEIPDHHSVFIPRGEYQDGQIIDPETVEFDVEQAGTALRTGLRIIVDNRVETVLSAVSLSLCICSSSTR